MALFHRLEVSKWRQFENVVIPLNTNSVILTGVNGSGKTTLLNVLSKHFGWNIKYISNPFFGRRKTERVYSDVFGHQSSELDSVRASRVKVGEIQYDNEQACELFTQSLVSANYEIEYDHMRSVEGLYIPSHRPAPVFSPVSQIPINPIELSQFYQNYLNLLSQSLTSQRYNNPIVEQKANLIALTVFGEASEHMDANPQYVGLINQFEGILAKALPKELGFTGLKIRTPDVIMLTNTGDFPLDAMSGGINALFSMLWQIFTFSINKERFVVTIDEPENHLHPSMQREFLNSLVRAFPDVRFIVSTHSPFIVSSFADATVISLQRNDDGRIYSQDLTQSDLAGSPSSILRDVLKVESTLPVWVEERIGRILEQTAQLDPEERGNAIISALEEIGIGDAISEYRSAE